MISQSLGLPVPSWVFRGNSVAVIIRRCMRCLIDYPALNTTQYRVALQTEFADMWRFSELFYELQMRRRHVDRHHI